MLRRLVLCTALAMSSLSVSIAGWEYTEQHSEKWKTTTHAIRTHAEGNAATLSLQRASTDEYDALGFVLARFTLDEELAAALWRANQQGHDVFVTWAVDDETLKVRANWYGETIDVFLSESRFEALAQGETLRIGADGIDPASAMSFPLVGLRTAFEQVEAAVPTVPERTKPLIAGVRAVTNPLRIESSYVMPEFPKKARYPPTEGNVILQAVVRADGSVGNISVIRVKPEGLGFEDAAAAAVKRWRYEPARLGGQAVDVYFTVVVDFAIRNPRR